MARVHGHVMALVKQAVPYNGLGFPKADLDLEMLSSRIEQERRPETVWRLTPDEIERVIRHEATPEEIVAQRGGTEVAAHIADVRRTELMDRAKAMYERGSSVDRIRKELRCSWTVVNQWVHSEGWARPGDIAVERRQRALEMVQAGVASRDAAAAVGVSSRTVRKWIAKERAPVGQIPVRATPAPADRAHIVQAAPVTRSEYLELYGLASIMEHDTRPAESMNDRPTYRLCAQLAMSIAARVLIGEEAVDRDNQHLLA